MLYYKFPHINKNSEKPILNVQVYNFNNMCCEEWKHFVSLLTIRVKLKRNVAFKTTRNQIITTNKIMSWTQCYKKIIKVKKVISFLFFDL